MMSDRAKGMLEINRRHVFELDKARAKGFGEGIRSGILVGAMAGLIVGILATLALDLLLGIGVS